MTQTTKTRTMELIEVDGIWMSKQDAPKDARVKYQHQQEEEIRYQKEKKAHSVRAKKMLTQELKTQKFQAVKQQKASQKQQLSSQNVQLQEIFHEFLDGFNQGTRVFAKVLRFIK